MGRRRGEPHRQALLPGLGAAGEDPAAWQRQATVEIECREFERAMIDRLGHKAGYARRQANNLGRMARACGAAGLTDLYGQPEKVATFLKTIRSDKDRRAVYRPLTTYVRLYPKRVPHSAFTRFEADLGRLFPGRASTRKRSHLVDRDFGGETGEVVQQPPTSLEISARILQAARDLGYVPRDVALVAVSLYSGCHPGMIHTLDWERILHLVEEPWSGEEPGEFRAVVRGKEYALACGVEAIAELRLLWLAGGRPQRGPVFAVSKGGPRSVGNERVRQVVLGALRAAGMQGLNRTRLNAPLAVLLRGRGWDDKRLASAFGYPTGRRLREHIEKVLEPQAQLRSGEVHVTDAVRSEGERADVRAVVGP